MGNWVDLQIDVLAKSPTMINEIERALEEPRQKLLEWAAKRSNQRVEDIADDVREIVRLKPNRNLGYQDAAVNKARRV